MATPIRPTGGCPGAGILASTRGRVTTLPQPVAMLSSPHAHTFRQRLASPHPDYHFLGDQLAHYENRRYRVSPADFQGPLHDRGTPPALADSSTERNLASRFAASDGGHRQTR